jgi:signal transduction histidine kinase
MVEFASLASQLFWNEQAESFVRRDAQPPGDEEQPYVTENDDEVLENGHTLTRLRS